MDILEGRYQLLLYDHNLDRLAVVNNYESLTYTVSLNGVDYHGWGSYEWKAYTAKMGCDPLETDIIVAVRRRPPTGAWRTEQEYFHRKHGYSVGSNGQELYTSGGFDLRHLLRRRKCIPPAGKPYWSDYDHATDIMNQLVIDQCTNPVDPARRLPFLITEGDIHYGGVIGTLAIPYNQPATKFVAESVEELSDAAESDWDVIRSDQQFIFKAYGGRIGTDRRVGNPYGNVPVTFSITMGNVGNVEVMNDRSQEVTAVYVYGDGVGVDRPVVTRLSPYNAQGASPWNRIEEVLEESSQQGSANLIMAGDVFLWGNAQKKEFNFEAIPSVNCLYGVHWGLGDIMTAYYRGIPYDIRAIEVTVVIDSSGEKITPTMKVMNNATQPDHIHP